MKDEYSYLADMQPIVIKDVFTKDEYKSVYESIESGLSDHNTVELMRDVMKKDIKPTDVITFINDNNGYYFLAGNFKQEIKDKVLDIFRQHVDLPENVMLMLHLARYTHDTGYTPSLSPHWDRGLRHPSYTMSIQLDRSLEWDLGVEDTVLQLEPNDAVIFSGSHQVHWRPIIEFSKDDVYDIIVCQVQLLDAPKINTEDKDFLMEHKLESYMKKTNHKMQY